MQDDVLAQPRFVSLLFSLKKSFMCVNLGGRIRFEAIVVGVDIEHPPRETRACQYPQRLLNPIEIIDTLTIVKSLKELVDFNDAVE